jgi:hypothetical protein
MDHHPEITQGRTGQEGSSISRAGCGTSLLLGPVLAAVFLANGRDLGTFDTVATTMLPITLIRGEGVSLGRFQTLLAKTRDGQIPPYVARSHQHIVSRYPVAPALLVVPLILPQVLLLDRVAPGWDERDALVTFNECRLMVRRALAVLMAISSVLLHRLLIGLGLRRVSVPAVVACALGSDIWAVASQALWQHGPAAFCLTSAMLLLHPRPPVSRLRLAMGGLAAGLLVACRLMDIVFALAILLYLARVQPRGLNWFLLAPVVVAALLLAYNLWLFGDPVGGQAQLERIHRSSHGVEGPWTGRLIEGAIGTLFSPNRGLFVFSPWVFLALLALPLTAGRIAPHALIAWLLWAIVPFFLMLSKYSVWWGGHCFGPRYWTDVMPLFAILLAFALDRAVRHARWLLPVFGVTIILSVALQVVGVLCFPSSWNLKPTNVDIDHARLWDWRDNEILRCIREYPGYHPHW